MQRSTQRFLLTLGLAGALGLTAPGMGLAQTQASERNRQVLEERLLPGWEPHVYQNLLSDLGYTVTDVEASGPDYVEYQVTKGQQRYTIQMTVNPRTDRVSNIDIARASQQQASAQQQRTQQQRQAQGQAQRTQSQRDEDETARDIPIVEEQVQVGKRQVQRGGVRVETGVEETPVERDVQLRQEDVQVYRRPADRPATDEDIDAAFDREVYVIPEIAEVPVIRKEPRVVGEVVIDKDVTQRQRQVEATQRRTTVDVEEMEPEEMERQAAVTSDERKPQQQRQASQRQQQQRMQQQSEQQAQSQMSAAQQREQRRQQREQPQRSQQQQDAMASSQQGEQQSQTSRQQLIQELEALPVGRNLEFYERALEQRGYQVLDMAEEQNRTRFEAEKNGQRVALNVTFDEASGRSTDIQASRSQQHSQRGAQATGSQSSQQQQLAQQQAEEEQ